MRSDQRSDRSPALHARARASSFGVAALALLCAPLSACVYPGEPGEDTGQVHQAGQDKNGLDPVRYRLSDLKWNGHAGSLSWRPLHTTGLHTGGVATANTVAWLTWLDDRGDGSLDVMTYLVKCAVPSGSSVAATVNGLPHIWYGALGLTPHWTGTSGLGTADQEWVSACVGAHVNLGQRHVEFSLRGENPALVPTASERGAFDCREAAFMGNLFAGWENAPLPLTQCHESTRVTATGRVCEEKDSFECVVACYAACDASSDDYTSCAATIEGSHRSYHHVITTYLPKDEALGCLGVGHDVTSHSAIYTASDKNQEWTWKWSYPGASAASCNSRCGGYAPSCSCTPDCAAEGTCCSDYAELCGSPPDPYATGSISGVTSGQSTCPAHYTRHVGSLSSGDADGSVPFVATTGTQHATLLGPAAADFWLELWRIAPSGGQTLLAQSNRGDSSASLHFFYGWVSDEYQWRVHRNRGAGDYVLCTSPP